VAQAFDALPPAGRRDWLDRFVREEALVREARRLGLDRDDDLIRRRLVQKMEFLAGDLTAERAPFSRAQLEAAYREQAAAHREPTRVDFTHVFVQSPVSSAAAQEQAEARAQRLLDRLELGKIEPAEAVALGDRFLYHRRYVDRTLEEVRSHFGAGFVRALSELEVDAGRWQGPLRSEHGWHLVRLDERISARIPPLAEIEPTLVRDLRRRLDEERVDRALEAVVSGYVVELGSGVDVQGH
jgi:hypothetical protein